MACEEYPHSAAAGVQTAQDKLDDSRAALERKAKLYERLATGQYADEGEVYNVDFLQKGTLEEEQQSLEREASAWRQHGTPEQPLDTAAGLLSSAGEASIATCLVEGLFHKSSTCLGLCEVHAFCTPGSLYPMVQSSGLGLTGQSLQ